MNKNIFYFITVFAVSALLFVSCGSVSKAGNADYALLEKAARLQF